MQIGLPNNKRADCTTKAVDFWFKMDNNIGFGFFKLSYLFKKMAVVKSFELERAFRSIEKQPDSLKI